jgi:hypothetical protein
MIKLFVYLIVLSSLSVPVVAQGFGKSAQVVAVPTAENGTSKQRDEKTQLEIEKLRLEMEALQHQQGWLEGFKGWIVPLATLIAGYWVFWKFVLSQEAYPHIEFTADINVIGEQQGRKLVELIAYIENKGSAKHQMNNLTFDLNALYAGEQPQGSERWRGQTDFPHFLGKGSFLPTGFDFFFVDPSVKAKYSHIKDVPAEATFLMLHCHFEYPKRRLSYPAKQPKFLRHAAERTICLVPAESKPPTEQPKASPI